MIDATPLVLSDSVVVPCADDIEVETVHMTGGWESMDRLVQAVQTAGRDVEHNLWVFEPSPGFPHGSLVAFADWRTGSVQIIMRSPGLAFDEAGGLVLPEVPDA